jgi:DNA-binding MarR family transcriptional regulator
VPTAPPRIHHALTNDDVERLRLVVLRLSRRIRTNSVDELTPSQQAVFASVAKNGPATIGRIAELEHVQPPSASKIVASLETRGLVERRSDPDDRRCSLIAITDVGQSSLEEARAAGRSWLAAQLNELGDADLSALAAALAGLEQLVTADS